MSILETLRVKLDAAHRADEQQHLNSIAGDWAPDTEERSRTTARAAALVQSLRSETKPSLMEAFLAEYSLSTDEGVALMCLAEALLRVPDNETIDALIEDKIAASPWGQHLGNSSSSLVNASTWGLLLTGKVLDDEQDNKIAKSLRGAIKRLGEPVIRAAVNQAMKELGRQFVLGQTMDEALERGQEFEKQGYSYSYDMLGEAAMTATDAQAFFKSYKDAIAKLGAHASSDDIRKNPGISIKLSALHPRYDMLQKQRVMDELVPSVMELLLDAKDARIGLNIDAEEANRLDLSLDVIETLMRDERLAGWDGFGIVVQAYSKRASTVIDWLHALATELDRKIMIRLVKGAYWDTEIKLAQVDGVSGFPVYTRKTATDVSYICAARQLLALSDRIYPQFATHNAHTIAAVLEAVKPGQAYEFQRLHGMGEAVHDLTLKSEGTACRIYAPVGSHRELLAYLVRRLLENGANSSFVNQIINPEITVGEIVSDPFEILSDTALTEPNSIKHPAHLFGAARKNSLGWDLRDGVDMESFDKARSKFRSTIWTATPLTNSAAKGTSKSATYSPSNAADQIGIVTLASEEDVQTALADAVPWSVPASERAAVLRRAADLYEKHNGELFAALTREAGKIPLDAVAELREAVDFLRFYACEAERLRGMDARGIITCISPWNFPLAIFTGQIAASLAAGNGVLSKPAEATPIIAWLGTRLLHEAGVPAECLQLLPGEGSRVGAAITSDARVSGVCFTGSTNTAQRINRTMAETMSPDAALIAETGGLNAMIVDSTALPEQAVRDILMSSFQSAGQRCSALRLLYVQEDVAESFKTMLFGAMDELSIADPWDVSTDVGPIISAQAKSDIVAYIEAARRDGKLIKQLDLPATKGHFIPPTVISVKGIEDMEREIFGPVLHIATFKANDINQIIDAVNASGYGLTFGLHSRIDDRVEAVTSKLHVGNVYVNRNQIGAIVESQPFGGEGLSGTGPKAGGPNYVKRLGKDVSVSNSYEAGKTVSTQDAQALIDRLPLHTPTILETRDMPGPTGESNRLSVVPKGTILCLGPTAANARAQQEQAEATGCLAVAIAPGLTGENRLDGVLDRAALEHLRGVDAVVLWSDVGDMTLARKAIAARTGALLPLISEENIKPRCVHERHLCIDTTAAGGNASLMADSAG